MLLKRIIRTFIRRGFRRVCSFALPTVKNGKIVREPSPTHDLLVAVLSVHFPNLKHFSQRRHVRHRRMNQFTLLFKWAMRRITNVVLFPLPWPRI